MSKKKKHLGSNFDDFLEEENLIGESEALAVKRILAYELIHEMEEQDLSKTALANLMHTSRSSLDRLLDPENTSVTLATMVKAAAIMNKKININII